MIQLRVRLISTLVCLFLASCFYPLSSIAEPIRSEKISAEDRQQILDLISRYSYAWDGKDAKAWASLFTGDAIVQTYMAGNLVAESNSDEQRRIEAVKQLEAFAKQEIQTRHFQTNTILTKHDDSSISGETMFFVIWQYDSEPAPQVIRSGVYKDIYKRSSAGWKFLRRKILIDHK